MPRLDKVSAPLAVGKDRDSTVGLSYGLTSTSSAKQTKGNAQWQRHLAVSHERIGDVLEAQGDLAGAAGRSGWSIGSLSG